MHRSWLLPALLLSACVVEGDDDDSAPPPAETTVFTGTLTADGLPQEGCEVGVEPADAVRSDASGGFATEVPRGATVHVRCPGAALRSFVLPDLPTIDWPISITLHEPPETPGCVLDVTADASGLGLENDDGTLEVRVVNSDATGLFNTGFRQTLRLVDFFAVPPGSFRVLARASGGGIAGFGRSALLTCEPEGGGIPVEVLLENASTRPLAGSWSGSDSFELAVSAPLDDPDEEGFGWLPYPILHALDLGAGLFEAELLDGVTDGDLALRGCRSDTPGRACVHRQAAGTATSVELGELPGHLLVQGRLSDAALTVQAERELAQGSITATVIDTEDLFDIREIWTGWSSTGAIEVPTAWFDSLPAPELLTMRAVAREGVVFDLAAGYLPTGSPDGWFEYRPSPSELSAAE